MKIKRNKSGYTYKQWYRIARHKFDRSIWKYHPDMEEIFESHPIMYWEIGVDPENIVNSLLHGWAG